MLVAQSYSQRLSRRFGWAASTFLHLILILLFSFSFQENSQPLLLGETHRIYVRAIEAEAPKKNIGQKPASSKAIPLSRKKKLKKKEIQKIAPTEGKNQAEQEKTKVTSNHPSLREFDQTILKNVRPHYPRVARRRGLEGKLKLKILVSPEGKVVSVTPFEIEAHESLVKAALTAAKQWSFRSSPHGNFQVIKNIIFQLN